MMSSIFQILPKLWWFLLTAFLLHQLVEKVFHWHFIFFDNYLDPFLSMPILLGIHLAERKILFQEKNTFTLPLFEVLLIGVFMMFIFEWGLPKWFDGFVYDPVDFVAYGLGVLVFIFFLNKKMN